MMTIRDTTQAQTRTFTIEIDEKDLSTLYNNLRVTGPRDARVLREAIRGILYEHPKRNTVLVA